jgi:poly-gamma-glutamate synthase PgsB/CapB
MEWIVVPIAGISAALLGMIMLMAWVRRSRRHRNILERMSPRILVTGTRGKSSTIRLVHSMLAEAHFRPWGRVTGTVAEELTPEGEVLRINRKGQHSVVELFDTVRRAGHSDAKSLVCECMAVKPDLIELMQMVFLRADIAVITNVRADHLEDEGLDLSEIAHSVCSVAEGAAVVISSETDPAVRAILRNGVGERGGKLLFATGSDVEGEILRIFPQEHPDNIAIALAIAHYLGISKEIALRGMSRATHEPFALDASAHRATFRSRELIFSNLGSINDPESARRALDSIKKELLEFPIATPARVAIIVSRWDRPFRSIQFSGFVDPAEFDAVLVAGELYRPMRRVLLGNGWEKNSIKPLRWIDARSSEAFMSRICDVVPQASEVHVISLANIDPPISRRLLHLMEPFAVSPGTAQ